MPTPQEIKDARAALDAQADAADLPILQAVLTLMSNPASTLGDFTKSLATMVANLSDPARLQTAQMFSRQWDRMRGAIQDMINEAMSDDG